MVSDAPLSPGSISILSFTPGVALTNVLVANFTDGDSTTSSTADYTATINWGDGTTSGGAGFTGNGGSYGLLGPHTYATSGTFIISGTIDDMGGAALPFTSEAIAAPEPGSLAMVWAGLALTAWKRMRRV